jgi:integrase
MQGKQQRAYRKKPLVVFENGTRVYSPSSGEPRYRVVAQSPDGTRSFAKFQDEEQARHHARRLDEDLSRYALLTSLGAPTTVEELARRYLASLSAMSVRYQERQTSMVRCWVTPHLGDLPLSQWTSGASEEVLSKARATRAPATVQGIGSTMRSMVTFASKHRWLSRDDDPMWRVTYSCRSEYQGQVVGFVPRDSLPTDEQCNQLFAALEALRQPTWALAMRLKHRSGLRWGELIALRASDIDTEPHRVVRVERAVEQSHLGRRIKTTKNRQQRYSIYPASLSGHLTQHLEEVRSRRGTEGLLFPGPDGGFAERKWFLRLWWRAARSADWPLKNKNAAAWHPHDLRHTAACWMLFDLRLDPAVAALLLGHANANFTLTRYVGVRGDPRQQLTDSTESW